MQTVSTAQSIADGGIIAVDADSISSDLALTLPDSSDTGEIKIIVAATEPAGSNNVVITPTNLINGSTITLNSIGDAVVCVWLGSSLGGWAIVSNVGAVVGLICLRTSRLKGYQIDYLICYPTLLKTKHQSLSSS